MALCVSKMDLNYKTSVTFVVYESNDCDQYELAYRDMFNVVLSFFEFDLRHYYFFCRALFTG